MFNVKRGCTVSSSVWLCQICLEAPLSQIHPEHGVQQKPSSRGGERYLVCPQFQLLQAGLRLLLCPWILVLLLWRREAGFAPRLPLLLLGVLPRLPLLSPPLHPSHTHARSHTLTHTLATLLLLLLLLMLMLLLHSATPLPFDGSLALTHRKPSVCILALRTGTHTDSPLHSR